jgi:DNA primase
MINFYHSLSTKYFDDAYCKAFLLKTGNTLKYFDISSNYDKIFEIDYFDKDKKKNIKDFLLKYKEVYVIPLELPDDSIIGFQLRSKNIKDFCNVKLNEKYPQIFGLYDFKDFKYNTPIILCEGSKDALFIKLFYKYTLAYLTSQPTKLLFEFLLTITNRIIFIPDNDDAGLQLDTFKKFKIFKKYHCNVLNYKDFGSYWEVDNDYLKNSFIRELETIINLEGLKNE